MMTLFTRSGDPKLVPECSLPLTAPSVVNRLYTDYGVFDLTDDGISVEAAFGASVDELAERLQLELRDASAR
jgi:3-oxoadipate CoA-transferase beta subunit